MTTVEQRLQRLEHRRATWSVVVGAVLFGGLLGSAADTTRSPLIGSSLTIVGPTGKPVVDISVGDDGTGRLYLRGPEGSAEVVLSTGLRGGSLSLLSTHGARLVNLGPSPVRDGMLVLGASDGETIVRAGRWAEGVAPSVWTASDHDVSGSSTP